MNAQGEEAVIVHEPRLSASTFPILRQAAVDGLGLALIPEFSCRELLASGALVQVLPDWNWPSGILHLVFTSRRGLLPSVRAVIDFTAVVLKPGGADWKEAI